MLEKTLDGCKLVFGSDPRLANCKEARNAKFATEKSEIGRIRRDQIAKRTADEEGGVTTVQQSTPTPSTSRTTASRPNPPVTQAGQVAEREQVVR